MVDSSPKPVVLITGVSGYLGSQTAYSFLKDGSYTVRGTVRDTKNPKKIEPLKKAFGELFDQMTLVEADLEKKESIVEAVKGANFVVHTASPFPLEAPQHENDLIVPAVQGTLAVMEACKAHKIKRCVITSSIAAIAGMRPQDKPANWAFTEEHWSEPQGDHIDAYPKSKTLAERAAWDFQKALPEEERTEIVTINPGFILGPAFVGSGFSSGKLVDQVLQGKLPMLPSMSIGCVDVRDCAEAHLQALKKPDAAGKRFILVKQQLWMVEIGQILKAEFGTKGYSVTTMQLPWIMAKAGSFFSAQMSSLMRAWGKDMSFRNTQSREVLGIQYEREMAQTINEMVYSMIETGHTPDKRPKL